MGSKVPFSQPTAGQLVWLVRLWQYPGGVTVQELYTSQRGKRKVGYTGVLRMMQEMHAKGILVRDTRKRAHCYSPAPGYLRDAVVSRMLASFVDQLFNGNMACFKQFVARL